MSSILLTFAWLLTAVLLLGSTRLLRAKRRELEQLELRVQRLDDVRAVLDRLRPSWRETDSTEAGGLETTVLMLVTAADNLLDAACESVPREGRSVWLCHSIRALRLDETFRAVLRELDLEPASNTEDQAP